MSLWKISIDDPAVASWRRLAFAAAVGLLLALAEWGFLVALGSQSSSEVVVYACMTVLLVLIGDLGASLSENRDGFFLLALVTPVVCHGYIVWVVSEQNLLGNGTLSSTATTQVYGFTAVGILVGIGAKIVDVRMKSAVRLIART